MLSNEIKMHIANLDLDYSMQNNLFVIECRIENFNFNPRLTTDIKKKWLEKLYNLARVDALKYRYKVVHKNNDLYLVFIANELD